jgi:hypothetical protein
MWPGPSRAACRGVFDQPPFAWRNLNPIRAAFSDADLVCLRSRLEHVPADDLSVFFDYLMNCGVERCVR